jgi:nitrogen fixation NifU-like protein
MSDFRDIYQEVILDHSKKPRNYRKSDTANRTAVGYNPLCGDKMTLFLDIEDGVIKDASFQGSGCAISTASASMMTETLKGKTVEEAEHMFQAFQKMVTAPLEIEPDISQLGKLRVFAGVREYPARVKCASLAWHTLEAIIKDKTDDPVSTE